MDSPQLLINLPTTELMEKFGAGGHKPGSGSAAALMGVLSTRLIATVCKLSLGKKNYQNIRSEIEFILDEVEKKREPKLRELFEKDSQIFNLVFNERENLKNAKNEEQKKQCRKAELNHLRDATEIPLEIGSTCLPLVQHGIWVFDHGFNSAQGDSGAAISASIAAVMASIYVANFNMTYFKHKSQWKSKVMGDSQDLLQRLTALQSEGFSRVAALHNAMPRVREDYGAELELDLGFEPIKLEDAQ